MPQNANLQFLSDPNGPGGLYGGPTGALLAAGASTAPIPFRIGAASQSLSAYPSNCSVARLQALLFGGPSISATNGLQWLIYSCSDGGTRYDSGAYVTGPVVAAVASQVEAKSIDLAPGVYEVVLTNLDATYSVNVGLSLGWLG